MIATFVKNLENFNGEAKLYRLSEPMETDGGGRTDFVVVSAVVAPYTGPETYIFAANEEGEVLNWGELPGSYRGGLDHEEALEGAGYAVA